MMVKEKDLSSIITKMVENMEAAQTRSKLGKVLTDALTYIDDKDERTKITVEWMKNLDDDSKLFFTVNWRMPHSLFNCACKFANYDLLQNICWWTIYKNHDMGTWSHGGKA